MMHLRRFYWTAKTLMVDHHDETGMVFLTEEVLFGNAQNIIGIHARGEYETVILDLLNGHFEKP